jgi:iron complex outermembrane receptor protein
MIDAKVVRACLLVGTALLATETVPFAYAQSPAVQALPAPAQADTGQLEEVTVTARRREEKLQDVPVAIAAIGNKELTDRQIFAVEDLSSQIPSVNVVPQNGTANMPIISIRGVSGGNLNPEVDSSIALYLDGVYIARSPGASFDMADLERVEVLRGPQGTLFGRNAEGGAISFITKAPTGEFGGHIETTFGDYDLKRVKASLNLPEINNIALKISVLHAERDGFVKNTTPGVTINVPQPFGPQTSTKTLGGDDTTGVMLAARYSGIDRLTVDYKFDFTSQFAEPEPDQVIAFDTGAFGKTFFALQPLVGGQNIVTPQYRSSIAAFTSDDHYLIYGHNLTAEYAVDDNLSIKSITAYRMDQEGGGFNTNEGNLLISPFTTPGTGLVAGEISCLLCSIAKRSQHQWSEELQVIGTEERFDYIGGLFFFDERGFQDDVAYVLQSFKKVGPNALSPGPLTTADFTDGSLNRAQNRSVAAYLHGTFHATDYFDVAVGVRHTEDRRYAGYWTTTPYATPGAEFLPPGPGGTFAKDFSHTDYEVTGTYKIQPDVNVYARVATGYVSGGVLHGHPYDPTTNTTYEGGLKSEWLDRKLRLNVAVFEQDQTDLQVVEFTPEIGTFFTNSGNNHTYGLEIEALYIPIDGLTLSANLGYDHFGLSNGLRIPQPDTTAFLSAEYQTPEFFNGMSLSARIDANYTSRYTVYTNPAADPAVDALLFTPAYWLLNARLSLLNIPTGSTTGKLSVWGKNLSNEHQLDYEGPFGLFIPGQFIHPRTYGVDLAVDF